jgi:RimJ/RimL family protein N-acetyltransferase
VIELREFTESDAAALVSWIDGPESLVLWSGPSGFGWPLDEAQILRYRATAGPRQRIWAAVAEDGPADPVGHASLTIDPHGWTGRLGRVLVAPAARGRGIGEALVRAAQHAAFTDAGVHRLALGVYAQNDKAIRLYERLGFAREGALREVAHVNGVWWSSIEMAILDYEWRAP